MKRLSTLTAAGMVAAMLASAAIAQPGSYGPPRGPHGGPAGYEQNQGQHYYNGRWVDDNEWSRHASERDRWAHNYQRRKPNSDSSALVAGILGFALGAAIVGSKDQAEHARTADQSWDAYCAKKYRSYDRHSRTYLGLDGVRHYCQ